MSGPCSALPLSQPVSYQRMNSPLGLMMDESLKEGACKDRKPFLDPHSTPLSTGAEAASQSHEREVAGMCLVGA